MRVSRVVAAGPALACALLVSVTGARAEPRPRQATAAGQVIETRGGETMRFLSESSWDPVEVRQELLAGDTLRTNETGALAILFADRTQVRVGRRSDLVVKSVSPGADGSAELSLNAGAVWARAERGGGPVTVQTPSVTTAIRGTDWSLTVGPDGKSTLIVLEGVVDMTNAQGSLRLTAGQAATAAVGQAPARIYIAQPNEREQMLFHLSPRDVFEWSRISPLPSRELRTRRLAIAAVPAEQRTPAEWLERAEIGVSNDGCKVVIEALDKARRGGLTPGQEARADLATAYLAARENRFDVAAALLARAIPRLDAARRPLAEQLLPVAEGLADPLRAPVVPKPTLQTPQSAIVEAWRIGFVGTPDEAIAFIRKAEQRFPDDPTLPAVRAAFELFTGRFEPMGEAVAQARAIDADDPIARQASAAYNSDALGALAAAHADLAVALESAPGDAGIWQLLAGLWYDQGGAREAEEAFLRSLDLAPNNVVTRMNYALFLLDGGRIREAQEQVAVVMEIAPDDPYISLVRGRLLLQRGETRGAVDDMLVAATANPAAATVLTGVAAAYYQDGNVTGARQALDNAARLDPSDPIPPLMQTAIALDDFRADDAIENARRATALYAARPGELASVSGTRSGGSFLADAYRFLGLEAWGRYQGDRLFDPFDATSYFDQAIVTEPHVFRFPGDPLDLAFADESNPRTVSSIVQGLALDPLAAASPLGRTAFLRAPFLDVELGGGFVARDGKPGWTGGGQIAAYSNGPVPLSVSLMANVFDDAGDTSGADSSLVTGTAFIGAKPTPVDNVVAFGVATRNEPSLPVIPVYPLSVDDRRSDTLVSGGVWSHEFGFRNVGTAAISYTGARVEAEGSQLANEFFSSASANVATDVVTAGYDHRLGLGALTLSAGVQGSSVRNDVHQEAAYIPIVYDTEGNPAWGDGSYSNTINRWSGQEWLGYVNGLYEFSRKVRVEGGLFLAGTDGTAEDDELRLDPRIGVAVSPIDNHWLRLAWRSVTEGTDTFTLAPVATVGLLGNLVPVSASGHSNSLIARWDAQWTPRIFTSVEYQGRSVEDLDQDIPDTTISITAAKARVDQLAASLNVWVGHGFGLAGTYVWTNAENRTPGAEDGEPISLVPTHFARAGLVFAHPLGIRAGLYESYVGERSLAYLDGEGAAQRIPLDSFFTTDFSVTYEPPDKRFEATLTALNLTDEDYWIAPNIPGSGRTLYGSLRVRF